jgi:hypothetical protein
MMAQYFNGKKKNLRYGLLFAMSLICGHVLGFAGRTLLGFMIQVIEKVGRRKNEWDRDPHKAVPSGANFGPFSPAKLGVT